jgi:hypothetical protein
MMMIDDDDEITHKSSSNVNEMNILVGRIEIRLFENSLGVGIKA